jgi:predicted ester cyclase
VDSSTNQNKTVIRTFFDAWNNRRPGAFDELIAPDVVRHCEATPDLEARCLDDVKEFLRLDSAVFPDSVQTIQHLLAEDDLVAAWTTYEGTQTGSMGPFPPSNRKVRFDFGAVFRMEGGKIAEWWVTWDNMAILRALGHLPAD